MREPLGSQDPARRAGHTRPRLSLVEAAPGHRGRFPHRKAMRDSGSKPGALQLAILGGSNRID
ncbi:hypothetical protein C7S17_5644 [Burkholderia thailandensis]|nr:hypothetical protein [Burkholderia thailandensis]